MWNNKTYSKISELLNRNKLSPFKILLILLLQILTIAIITFFSSGYRFISIPQYELNDIAREDVISPEDFEVIDMKLTAVRKDKARENILPLYDYDPEMTNKIEKSIRTAFEQVRQILKEKEKNDQVESNQVIQNETVDTESSDDSSEKEVFYNEVKKIFGNKITDRQIDLFLTKKFNLDIENLVISVLIKAQSQKIITTFDDFVTNDEGLILIRNISTNKEEVVKNTKNIIQLSDARQMIPFFYPGDMRYAQVNLIKSFVSYNLSSNLSYNINESKQRQDKAAESVQPTIIKIKKGKTIVRRGDEITEDTLQQVQELQKHSEFQIKFPVIAANALFVLFLLSFLWFYINESSQQNMENFKKCVMICNIIILNVLLLEGISWLFHKLSESFTSPPFDDTSLYFYALPFTMCTMLVALLIDKKVSLYFAYIGSIITFLHMSSDIHNFFFILFGNVIAVYGIDKFKGRTGIIKTGFVVAMTNLITFILIKIIEKPDFEIVPLIFGMGTSVWGSFLAVFFVFAFISPFESLFQVTTDVKLLELSNMDLPALRKLADMAPGTYHHSLIVGTLSEAAAKTIGANPLLARVACYYHDIGKSLHPEYFIENQYGGFNIHNNCTPVESSEKIISHVEAGLEIADEIKLPNPVKDIIAEHHGTKRLHYFYEKARELNGGNEKGIDENVFRYPGPRPRTKESAIIMLADAVEAASRTIKEPTPDKMRAMVRKLIDINIEDGQFKDCNVTVGDLEAIKSSFLEVLSGYFHHRIQYQGLDFDKGDEKNSQ